MPYDLLEDDSAPSPPPAPAPELPTPPARGFDFVDEAPQPALISDLNVPTLPGIPSARAVLSKAKAEAQAGMAGVGAVAGRVLQSKVAQNIMSALSRVGPGVPGGITVNPVAMTPDQSNQAFANLGQTIEDKSKELELKYDAISKQAGRGILLDAIGNQVRGAAQMLPAIAMAPLAPAAVMLGYFPLLSFDSTYQAAKAKGYTDGQALGTGLASAAITAVAGKLFGPGGETLQQGRPDSTLTGIFQKVIDAQIHGAGGMAKFGISDQIGQEILRKATLTPDKPIWESVSDVIGNIPAHLVAGAAMATPGAIMQGVDTGLTGLGRATRLRDLQTERESPARRQMLEREGMVNSIMQAGNTAGKEVNAPTTRTEPESNLEQYPGNVSEVQTDGTNRDEQTGVNAPGDEAGSSGGLPSISPVEGAKTLAESLGDYVSYKGYFGPLVRDESGRVVIDAKGQIVELPYHESTPVSQTEISEVIPRWDAFMKPKTPVGLTADGGVMVDGKRWSFYKNWQSSIKEGEKTLYLQLFDANGRVGYLGGPEAEHLIDQKLAVEVAQKDQRATQRMDDEIAREAAKHPKATPAKPKQKSIDEILAQHHNANVDVVDAAFASSPEKRPSAVQQLPDQTLLSARSALESIVLELQEAKHDKQTIKIAQELLGKVEGELGVRVKSKGQAASQPGAAEGTLGLGRARAQAVERPAAKTADVLGKQPEQNAPVELPIEPGKETSAVPPEAPVKPKKRKAAPREERPPDIIDEITQRITGKIKLSSARALQSDFRPTGALRGLFGETGLGLDETLDALHREGLAHNIETDDELLTALHNAARGRIEWRKEQTANNTRINTQEAQRVDFEKVLGGARAEGEPEAGRPIPVHDLLIGTTFDLAGEKVKVADLVFDPDTSDLAYVVLEDGRRFDVQTVGAEETIHPDKGTLHKTEASTDFLSPADQGSEGKTSEPGTTPKLRPGEKQGDVFAKQEEPLKLVGEKTTDGERVAQEKAAQEKAAAEAKAIEAKQQPPLFPEASGLIASLENAMTPEERAELAALEADLREKLKRTSMGVDPSFVVTGGRIAFLFAKAGMRKFRDFAQAMLAKFGEQARPYLMAWYSNVRSQFKGEGFDHEADAQAIYDREFARGDDAAVAQRGGAVPEAVRADVGKRSPVARVVRKELIPQPRSYVRADSYAGRTGFTLSDDQTLGINQATTHFLERNGPAFIIADGTGFGKSAQLLGAIDQFRKARPGAKIILVTQNQQMIKGSITGDAKAMGIDLRDVMITTYSKLGGLKERNFDLAIFDEAHNLKNADAQKSMAAARIQAKHTMFSTATPMDRPTGAAYFLAKILGKDELDVAHDLGYDFQERIDPITQDIHMIPVLREGFSWPKVWANIMAYRDAAIMGGAMLRREYPFYGNVEVREVPLDRVAMMEHERIAKTYDRLIESVSNPTARRNYSGQKTLTLGRWTEQQKVQTAFDLAMKHIAEGGQVIIMAETDKDQSFPEPVRGGVEGTNDKGNVVWRAPGAITQLTKMFEEKGIPVAHIHDTTKNNVAEEVDKFQSGKAPVALATPQSGGAGINLDDVVGNKPRLLEVLSKNLAGDMWDQVLGRVSRKTTQSEAKVIVLNSSESYGDQRRDDILTKKLRTLRAIQGGEDVDRAQGFEVPNEQGKPVDILDRLEGMKIKGGTLQSALLPGFDPATFSSVWNTALDLAIKGIKAGRAIRDAVKDAVEYLRTKATGPFDEAAVTKALLAEDRFKPSAETQVQGTTWRVLGKDTTVTAHDIEASRATAEGLLAEAGIARDYRTHIDPRDGREKGYIFWPKSPDITEQGKALVEVLKREIAAQHEPGKAATHLAALIQSIRDNFRDHQSGMADMDSSVRKELFRLAQREASFRGAALGALSHFRGDLLDIAQNVDVFLDEVWRERYGGEHIEDFVDAVNRGGVKAGRDSLNEAGKAVMGNRQDFWNRIERLAVKSNGHLTVGDVIKEIARMRKWPVPSEEDIATLRQLAAKEQWLRTLSPERVAEAGGDPMKLQEMQRMLEAATRSQRMRLLERMQTMWGRFERPLNLTRWFGEHRANNAAAGMEWIQANLLARVFFGTRQFTQIVSQMPVYKVTRAFGNAWARFDSTHPETFWARLSDELGNAMRAYSVSKPLRHGQGVVGAGTTAAFAAFRGRGEGRDVEQLMTHGVRIFDRMRLKAEALDAEGKHAQAAVLKIAGIMQYGYRVAQAIDAYHGVPAEFQEMAHQIDMMGQEIGWNRAMRARYKDQIIGGMAMDYAQAEAFVERLAAERGETLGVNVKREQTWNVVKAMAYQKMRELSLPADAFEERNADLRNQIGWNLKETRGPGGLIGNFMGGGRQIMTQLGIPLPIFSFANAIGTAVNRALHFTPFYRVTNLGKGEVSPWWKTPEDRAQRRAEAWLGTIIGTPLLALAAGGMVKVQLRPPTDPEERAVWESQGHKAGTVEFATGQNSWITLGLTVGPLQTFAPYLAAGGAWNDAQAKIEKKQKRLETEAAKLGVPAGKVKGIGLSDLVMIAGEAAWQSILGGRTASGMINSITDQGTPNTTRAAAGQVGPFVPGLPAYQEMARAAGVNLDAKLESFWDALVPMPTSPARRVNMLGDPVGTQDDLQRVMQMATGGNYLLPIEGRPEGQAYRTIASVDARPGSIDPNKGYLIDGKFRPLTDAELEKFTVLRGQKIKAAVEAVGSVDGMDPIEANKAVRQAITAGSRQALADMGVSSTETASGAITGGPGGALKSALPAGLGNALAQATGLPGAGMGRLHGQMGLRRVGRRGVSVGGSRALRPARGGIALRKRPSVAGLGRVRRAGKLRRGV